MKRLIYALGLCVALFFGSQQRASAQFATFDASNLAQSILGFLQDGDNMVINTEQFLQNLGVAKEQLEFLEEMNKRYKEVRGDIFKAQSVIQMAKNYEQMASMFVKYVDRVKRAREYLDSKSQVSEEERMAQLAECNRQISKANAAMYNHIRGSYEDIDRGMRLAEAYDSLEDAFKINW